MLCVWCSAATGGTFVAAGTLRPEGRAVCVFHGGAVDVLERRMMARRHRVSRRVVVLGSVMLRRVMRGRVVFAVMMIGGHCSCVCEPCAAGSCEACEALRCCACRSCAARRLFARRSSTRTPFRKIPAAIPPPTPVFCQPILAANSGTKRQRPVESVLSVLSAKLTRLVHNGGRKKISRTGQEGPQLTRFTETASAISRGGQKLGMRSGGSRLGKASAVVT